MNDFLKNLIEKIPGSIIRLFLYATLITGVLFFTLRAYDVKTGSSTPMDNVITGVTGVCIEDGIEECTKFSVPRKIRVTVTDIPYRKDEKAVKIIVDR